MEADDVLAIHDLMARYGHLVDERRWSQMDELFTDDVVYDLSEFGFGVHRGIDGVRAFWSDDSTHHPVAHHVSTISVREDPDGTVRTTSKILCVRADGRVSSFAYADVVVQGADGRWRMAERVVSMRRPETIPAPS